MKTVDHAVCQLVKRFGKMNVCTVQTAVYMTKDHQNNTDAFCIVDPCFSHVITLPGKEKMTYKYV
ncbi:hypothetical protein D3C77_799740 [compost metagenome]